MSDKPLMKNDRLEVVDALRGFALLAIVLIHNVEHYNMIGQPELLPEWLGRLDEQVETAIFFLLAGKAYATFSLLFGFSFYIQLRNQRARGGDFKGRFAWRMVLLIFFSQLHALFYNGDILLLYAFMGFTLIAVCDWSDRKVFLLATICLLQPVEWIRVVCGLINPDFKSYGDLFYTYYLRAMPILEHGTLPEVLYSNITDGQLFSNLWQIENGRLFQVPALFMFGMLLGRRNYFVRSDGSVKFWKKFWQGLLLHLSLFIYYKSMFPDFSKARLWLCRYRLFCLLFPILRLWLYWFLLLHCSGLPQTDINFSGC